MTGSQPTQPTRIVPTGATRLRYVFSLSRPRYWHYLWSPVVLGLVYGASTVGELVTVPVVAFAAYFLIPGNIFLYGVNDAFDTDTDEFNEKKSADGPEQMFERDRYIVATIVICGLAGVALFGFLSRTIAVAALAGWVFLTVQYSAPPLRLKSVPFVDSLSNGLYVLPGIAAYVMTAGTLPPIAAVVGFWLWTMAYHTFAAIPDIEPDRKAGVRTLATVLGEQYSLGYCFSLWLLASLIFWGYHPLATAVFVLYPVIVVYIRVRDIPVERAYWWFPTINAVVGLPLIAPGVWILVS